MSSQPANFHKEQRRSTLCVTCRSRQVQCNGIHPSCGPCKDGNRTCVWPEDGNGPRRGSFTATARPSISALNTPSISPLPRRSQRAKAPVASGGQREGSGGPLKAARSSVPPQTQQVPTSQQIPNVTTKIHVISFKKLREGDEETSAELQAACTNEGCFWLDLESEGEILRHVEWLLRMAQTLHDVPQAEKWKYEEESPEGNNNIRYDYTTLPSDEIDHHLSETWSFDLSHSANTNDYNWPTQLQNTHSSILLTTISHLHTLLSTLPTPPTPKPPTSSHIHLSLSRYPPNTIPTPPSNTPPLLQQRHHSEGITLLFAPVPGTFIQSKSTGSLLPVVDPPMGEGRLRYVFVSVGGEVGGRCLWDMGVGRPGEGEEGWYEVCSWMGGGGNGVGEGWWGEWSGRRVGGGSEENRVRARRGIGDRVIGVEEWVG